MIQYPLNTFIQQFQRLENVSSDLMNVFYKTTTENLNAYFPISPCVMSGINDINNNYGQIGTSNVFEFAAGAIRFPNQITVIPNSTIKEFTWASYAGGSVTLTGITDGTVYYCVAKLTQVANDSYKVTNTMTIPTTVVTASELNDQNIALFAITADAGVYTVSLDDNCAYNYGVAHQIQSDFNRSVNLESSSGYNVTLADGFSYLYNNGSFITYLLPSNSTLPIGFTVCIKNQNGRISTFESLITMTSAYSNAYYKCEVGDNGWIIDGQPIITYSQWATQAWAAANSGGIVQQGSNSSGKYVKFSNGFIQQYGDAVVNGATTYPTPFTQTPRVALTVRHNGIDTNYVGAVTLYGAPGITEFTTTPIATVQGTPSSGALGVMYFAEGF